MSNNIENQKWSNNYSFILSAAGSAIGLGNIWKFPYMVGQQGGAAFVIIYLIAIFLIGIPVLITEILVGKVGKGEGAYNAVDNIIKNKNKKLKIFKIIAYFGIISAVLLNAFYFVVGGWTLNFSSAYLINKEINLDSFSNMLGNGFEMYIFFVAFSLITILVIIKGLHNGIEKINNIIMPSLFIFLIIMLIYSIIYGDFKKGFDFLFHFDFKKLTWPVVMSAVSHAFFSLSVGTTGIIAYGTKLDSKDSVFKNGVIIGIFDTLFALIVGLIIYPMVFKMGLEPSSGPGLLFSVIPEVLKAMPFTNLVGFIFFLMVFFAAFTSAINLIEVPIEFLIAKFKINRTKSVLYYCISLFSLGLLVVLGFSTLQDLRILPFGVFKDLNIMDVFDYIVSNIMFPLNALITCLLVAWVMNESDKVNQLKVNKGFYKFFDILLKFFIPIILIVILINSNL